MRLTDPQRKVIEFMLSGQCFYIDLYPGDVGTEGRGSGLYFSTRLGIEKPKITFPTLNALLARGLLEEKDGGFKLTQKGKEWKP